MKFKNSYMKNFLKFFICILIAFTIIATVNASENYVNENKEINNSYNENNLNINNNYTLENTSNIDTTPNSQEKPDINENILIKRPNKPYNINYINSTTFDDLKENNINLSTDNECHFISQDIILNQKETPFVVKLIDNYGNPLFNESVIFTIQGVSYNKITDNDGNAKLNIHLAKGLYTINFAFKGNCKYKNTNGSRTITVVSEDNYCINNSISKVSAIQGQKNTILIVDNLEMFYKSGASLNVVLKDQSNNLLINQNIIFEINNKNYTKTTNNKGIASLTINLLPGTYIANIYYEGCDNYMHNSAVANVIVKTTIQSNDIVKMYLNNTQFHATFLNPHGMPLTNTEITFNINGIFYKKMTNNDGMAELKINLDPGNYIITIINPLTGEQKGNNITVNSPIVENSDLIKYYKNASRFNVRILSSDGTPAHAGENVTFNINGVFYTKQTDNNGYCSIGINLMPGDYIITTIYNNCKIGNNIKVLSVIITNDLRLNKSEKCIFPVRLVDGQGNSISSEILTFNINGIFYQKTTNDKGMAYLNLNFVDVGEYIVTIQHNDAIISNKIIITNQSSPFANNLYFNKSNTVLLKNIINTAFNLNNYINTYLILPEKVNILGKQLTIFEFSYLMANTISNINNGANESSLYVPFLSKNIVYENHYTHFELNQYTYLNLIDSILLFTNINGYMPNNITLINKSIDFKTYTYALAKILSYYNITKTFPSQCNFESTVQNYTYINTNDLDKITQFGKGLNEYNYDTNIELYLINGTDCEITQRITNLANNLVNHMTLTKDKVKILYQYVQNIPYCAYYPKKGIDYVLNNGKGNYIDKTNLFVALCRACNIPAKYNSGHAKFNSGSLNHLWSQILIDDWWYVADTSTYKNSIGTVNNWKTNTITNFSQGNLYSNLTNTSLTYNGPFKQQIIQDKNVTFTYSTSSSGNIINPIFNSNSYTKLEFTTTNASYGSPSIYLKLTDNQNIPLFNKTIFLSVLGKLYTAKTDLFGYADFNNVDLTLGTYKITATFKSDGKYPAIEKDLTLNVTKTKTNLITNNVIQSGKSFKIYLEDQYGKSLSNQVIELKIGNVHHSLKTNNIGFASINLNLTNGKYVVDCIFNGNKYYSPISSKFELIVKNNTKINGKNVLLNNGDKFTINLYSNNKILSNKIVQLKILDSKLNLISSFEYITNNNGTINVPITLNPGKYTIFYQFNGSNKYLESHASSTIYIVPNDTKINTHIEINTNIIHENGEYFIGILKDSLDNSISNATCYISVNGVTYTKTTDSKGEFKLKIRLNKGTYSVFCNFNNNNKYDSCFTHVLLNVSHIHNLIYSVKISLKNPIQFNNKYYSVPYGREIGIYKNNNLYKFGYDYTTTGVSKLDYNKLYFISLTDNNQLQIINSESEICSCGFSLFSNGENVLVKYYGYKNNNLTRFDAIYDGKKYFNKQIENVTLILNENTVGIFYFSSELITPHTQTYLKNIGINTNYKYYNDITTKLTLNPGYWNEINSISVKTLRYGDTDYDNKLRSMNWNSNLGYETVESFLNIKNIKVTDEFLAKNLNQSHFNTRAEYIAYTAYLTNLGFRWLADKLADEISENYGVKWFLLSGSTGMTRTSIGLDGINFDDIDNVIFQGDNIVSYKANNEYYLKSSVLEEYIMYLHGGNSTCGVKEVINGLINDKDMYCNISSRNLTLGLTDDSATLIFNLISGGVASLIRPDIMVNQTQNGGVYLGDFSFLNIGTLCDNLINVYNVIKSPDDMAGYICDQLGWDERAKTMLSFTLDVAVSVAVIGFTIAFPEFVVPALILKGGCSLWSNGVIKNPMDRTAWSGVAIDLFVGRAGSNAVNYFIRHSKDTKLNHAIAEGLWYVNVENPVNMLKTASNKVVDIFGEKNNG